MSSDMERLLTRLTGQLLLGTGLLAVLPWWSALLVSMSVSFYSIAHTEFEEKSR